MKPRIYIALLTIIAAVQSIFAFTYDGVNYYIPSQPDADLLCGETPVCYVSGFANSQSNYLSIPPDWVFDEKGNAYWPIKIMNNAFSNSNLMEIESLGTIQKIGSNAFAGTKITHVESITVMKIEDKAFYNCRNLASAQFAAVSDIGHEAFNGCTLLATADFPLVNNIGEYAFANSEAQWCFIFPITLQSIGRYAFFNCPHLRITFASSMSLFHTIPEGCFKGCHDLKKFEMPHCVKRIEQSAFAGCSSLDEMELHDEVNYVGANAFDGCTQLTYVAIKGACDIAANAFSNCSAINTVQIYMDKNTTPFYQIFPHSSQLQKVIVRGPSTCVGKIYEAGYSQGEFANYTNLKEVQLPSTVKIIGDLAFSGCTALTSISLPEGIDSIGARAFYGAGLQSVTFPNSVTYLGEYVFDHCSQLESVYFSSSLTYIPRACFRACESLKTIYIPKNIKQIGWEAFDRCTALENITVAGGVSTISRSDVFRSCTALRKLSILYDYEPDRQEYHPQLYSLFNLQNLEELVILKGSKCLGTLTDNSGEVGSCPKLIKVILPEGLTALGTNVFYGCSGLTKINLPSTLTDIGSQAYALCSNVQQITCKATTPPNIRMYDNRDSFYQISRSIPVYVPFESIDLYKKAPIWKEFFIQDIKNKPYDPDDDTEDVKLIQTTPSSHKYLHNGQVLIERNSKIYTLQGQEVK